MIISIKLLSETVVPSRMFFFISELLNSKSNNAMALPIIDSFFRIDSFFIEFLFLTVNWATAFTNKEFATEAKTKPEIISYL